MSAITLLRGAAHAPTAVTTTATFANERRVARSFIVPTLSFSPTGWVDCVCTKRAASTGYSPGRTVRLATTPRALPAQRAATARRALRLVEALRAVLVERALTRRG